MYLVFAFVAYKIGSFLFVELLSWMVAGTFLAGLGIMGSVIVFCGLAMAVVVGGLALKVVLSLFGGKKKKR